MAEGMMGSGLERMLGNLRQRPGGAMRQGLEATLSGLIDDDVTQQAEGRLFDMLEGPGPADAFRDADRSADIFGGILERQRERYGVAPTERGMAQEQHLGALDRALGRTQAVSDAGIMAGAQRRQLMAALTGMGQQELGGALQGLIQGERLAEMERQRRAQARQSRFTWLPFGIGEAIG